MDIQATVEITAYPMAPFFLSNQRVIFLTQAKDVPFNHLKDLNVPLQSIKEGRLVQPWFDANHYCFLIIPTFGGGLPSPAEAKLIFREGGAIEFATILRQLFDRIQETGEIPSTHEPLPAYSPPEAGTNGSSAVVAEQAIECPPPYDTTSA